MGQLHTTSTTEISLADGESETIKAGTSGDTDTVYVLIDGGTTGGTPAGYQLTSDVHVEGTYYRFDEVGSSADPETASSWTDPAVGQHVRYTLTNVSGGSATFRIMIFSQE